MTNPNITQKKLGATVTVRPLVGHRFTPSRSPRTRTRTKRRRVSHGHPTPYAPGILSLHRTVCVHTVDPPPRDGPRNHDPNKKDPNTKNPLTPRADLSHVPTMTDEPYNNTPVIPTGYSEDEQTAVGDAYQSALEDLPTPEDQTPTETDPNNPDAPTEKTTLKPYNEKHIRAQRIMAIAVDPDTGKRLSRTRIAEICGVHIDTLRRWIIDKSRGGETRWFEEVDRYLAEMIRSEWPMLVRAQMRNALNGSVGSFRNIARLVNKLGPDVEVHAEANAFAAPISATIVVQMPDNGRSKETCPEAPGKFAEGVEPGRITVGGNGDGNGNGDGGEL